MIKSFKSQLRRIFELFGWGEYPLSRLWTGDYGSWDQVASQCQGYEAQDILEKVSQATRKVVNKSALYERDSVTFNEVDYSWPLMAALLKSYIKFSECVVLDFGGSLGSSYRQTKVFTGDLALLDWNIVEQKKFVEVGRNEFSTKNLSFYYDIQECVKEKSINFILISSVLEYLENPGEYLDQLLRVNAPTFVLDRIPITNAQRNILTKQVVASDIYDAAYPCWFFSRDYIISFIEKYGYELTVEDISFVPNRLSFRDGTKSSAKIMIFEKKLP